MLLLLLNDKKAVFLGVRFHWRFKGVLSSLLQWKRRSDLKRQNAKVYKVEMLRYSMKNNRITKFNHLYVSLDSGNIPEVLYTRGTLYR